jgi:hypothetical protein
MYFRATSQHACGDCESDSDSDSKPDHDAGNHIEANPSADFNA